ncbi:hypothetical protein WA158_004248 [Blastocystis sp. Blastoise]
MSEELFEDKYLFTFQDETQLWISKEFIVKYRQFPFYDIIKHPEKYEDGSFYIDMPSLSIEKVIHFLMEDAIDICSLNLKDSYDIYKTLIEYSVTVDNELQSDLLFHVKELFYKYLKNNNYSIYEYNNEDVELTVFMDLYSSDNKQMCVKGLFTQQRKDELLYYSLLIKMMNITTVDITYDYSSNIVIEYICPSCIKEIFPSLHELKITVNSHYKQTELLLNPNSDEYIMEYTRLFSSEKDLKVEKPEKYEYYTESEMNEYNKISSLDINNIYYPHKLVDSYNEKKEKSELPKLYKYMLNEGIYTNDDSNVEMNETYNEYTLNDQVSIKYNDTTNDKIIIINKVSSKLGISQLFCLPSYLYAISHCSSVIFMKLFEENLFDSLTVLSVNSIKELTDEIDENLLNKIMATHVFPNVTEIIYDSKSFQLSLLNKECFPKLHIINYEIEITTKHFESLFPMNLISMIDTIRINSIDYNDIKEIILLFDKLVYTHSIHIYGINDFICYLPHLKGLLEKNLISFDDLSIYSSRSGNIRILDSIEKNKQNINSLNIQFENSDDYDSDDYDSDDYENDDYENDDYDSDNYDSHDYDSDNNDDTNNETDSSNENDTNNENDKRSSLERFLKSSVLQHLNDLTVIFDYGMSIEYLTWISTLFNDNKFNNIQQLTIDLESMEADSSSEYITAYENILEKLIPKASIVDIEGCTMSFINRLIPKGCFYNTTKLTLGINDIPDEDFCKLYTTDNFPQLKYIKFCDYHNDKTWWSSFFKTFCNYIHNNNFLSSCIVHLNDCFFYVDYIYDPNTSILRCKYDTNSFIDSIMGTKDEMMSRYEIETLFDYIYDEEQLSKLINLITTEKIPKLKEFICYLVCINVYDGWYNTNSNNIIH